jgi:hypothetical protein
MSNDLRRRVLNIAGSQAHWAEVTGMSKEHVSRVMGGHYPPPAWWEPMVELLERLPRKDWPERWGREREAAR